MYIYCLDILYVIVFHIHIHVYMRYVIVLTADIRPRFRQHRTIACYFFEVSAKKRVQTLKYLSLVSDSCSCVFEHLHLYIHVRCSADSARDFATSLHKSEGDGSLTSNHLAFLTQPKTSTTCCLSVFSQRPFLFHIFHVVCS